MITQKQLKQLLHYDPTTGVFRWRVSRSNGVKIGDIAGWNGGKGYACLSVGGKIYKAHRLAWLYMTGNWPAEEIDHIDCCRNNNKFSNLREATRSQNRCNSKIHPSNTSGYKGVSWHTRYNKWIAHIKINNKKIYLGYFLSAEAAHYAYVAASKAYHGKFGRVK